MDRIPTYLVVKPTGQFDPDGRELVIVYAVKTTYRAAEGVVNANPGTKIVKEFADKQPSISEAGKGIRNGHQRN